MHMPMSHMHPEYLIPEKLAIANCLYLKQATYRTIQEAVIIVPVFQK
jgi:hypothetical protein